MSERSLKLFRDSNVYSTVDNGKEPNEWKVEYYASTGTSEEFVEQFSGELLDLIDASSIYEPERQKLKDAILMVLLEGLMPAFEHLKRIRSSVGQEIPSLNRRQLYEDFNRSLWHAYKDLMPRAAILLGFDLGFLFRREAGFESGVGEFNAKHPSLIMRVCDYLRQQRITWQNGLGGFRNLHLEHRKEGPERFAKYSPVEAEVLFDSAWRTMADVFLVFIESHFPASHSIEEIPASERDPSRRRRFRIVWLRAAPKP